MAKDLVGEDEEDQDFDKEKKEEEKNRKMPGRFCANSLPESEATSSCLLSLLCHASCSHATK